MPVKFGEGDNEVGLQVIRSIVSRKLLALPPSVGKLSPDIALCGPTALLLESLAPFLTSRQCFMFSDFFSFYGCLLLIFLGPITGLHCSW
jgi:hypothetical protein